MNKDNNNLIIAIDGPSAAGKSTVARLVSKRLGIHRLDTGALFRALAWKALETGAVLEEENSVIQALRGCELDIDIEGETQITIIDGLDVTDRIRAEEVSRGASALGLIPEVRRLLTNRVRDMASQRSMVVDGRDIGTAMLPEADLKIYLVADAGERARRRCEELRQSGRQANYEDILAGILSRDEKDASRSIAPLKKAEDAIQIDTSHLSIESVVDMIVELSEKVCHG